MLLDLDLDRWWTLVTVEMVRVEMVSSSLVIILAAGFHGRDMEIDGNTTDCLGNLLLWRPRGIAAALSLVVLG